MRVLFVIMAALVAVGCAGAPDTVWFPTERVFPQSKDAVWTKVVRNLTSQGVPIQTIQKDSGVILATNVPVSAETAYLSCGYGLSAGTNLTINILVEDRGAETYVRINVSGNQLQIGPANRALVQCNSSGALENGLMAAIAAPN